MSKRTLILIAFLIVLTGIFVYLAVSQSQPKQMPVVTKMTPTVKPVPAYTTLMLSPSTLSLSSNSGSLAVMIDTGKGSKTNAVTAIQMELQYDPKMITNVILTPGTFIPGAAVLVNTTDKLTGRMTYALAIPPSGDGTSGVGTVATIQFQSLLPKGKSTQFSLLPTTLVTAQGIAESVFLKGTNATITAGSIGGITVSPTSMQVNQPSSPKAMKGNNSQASEKNMKGNKNNPRVSQTP